MLSHYLHQWIHHPHLKLCWFGQHHFWIYLLLSKLSWVSCKKIFSLIYLLWALCLVLNTWHVNENDNQMHTCVSKFILTFKISVCLKLHPNIAITWYPLMFCFAPSVKIGDCALWHQKWLSMLALMPTICCTLQIVWHQSSMQKPVVRSKFYINYSLPIVCAFFFFTFSTLTVSEYIYTWYYQRDVHGG